MPADKTGRSIFFNCSRPGSRNDLKFFSLCPCLYWAPATKVSSRPDENFLSERLYNRPHGTKFYQLKAKMEANKFPSSHFSMEDKRVAVELWKAGVPLKNIREQLKMSERSLFMRLHGTTHFLQDGAPCHRSKIVKSWFAERPEIKLIDWPGNSPDLNPIENVWSWMKNKLQGPNCIKKRLFTYFTY